jgi:hypothetical protein
VTAVSSGINVLWFTICPAWMKPPPLSQRMIVAGPDHLDSTHDGLVRTIRVAGDRLDVGALVARLPADQYPDLVVVETDGFSHRLCVAVNLAPVRCPKLLIVGDTHHGTQPLLQMLQYATQTGFDRAALTYTPHHVHWFAEMGALPVTFIPSLHIEHVPVAFSEQRKPAICRVGQAGEFHVRRRRLLQALERAGMPAIHCRGTSLEIAQAYATYQITWNCSLNGDFNLKHFEVLGAGGFLLSDRMSAASGVDRFLRDGEHFATYESESDLIDKLEYYLARPDHCLRIARAGQEAVLAAHTRDARAREILDFAFSISAPDLSWDARSRALPAAARARMNARVRLYELVQELHRCREQVAILCCGELPDATRADLSDLVRCRIHAVADMSALPPDARARPWDVLIATFADLARDPAAFEGLAPAWFVSLEPPAGRFDVDEFLDGRFELQGTSPWIYENRAPARAHIGARSALTIDP